MKKIAKVFIFILAVIAAVFVDQYTQEKQNYYIAYERAYFIFLGAFSWALYKSFQGE